MIFCIDVFSVNILDGIEYQHDTPFNMRIVADHETSAFVSFLKSIFR